MRVGAERKRRSLRQVSKMHAIMVFSKGMIIRKQSRELVPKGRLWVPYSRQYGSGRVGHDKHAVPCGRPGAE